MKKLWLMLFISLGIYGIQEGYSVITPASPFGDVIVWVTNPTNPSNYGWITKTSEWGPHLAELRSIYTPKLDSAISGGISWNRPNCMPDAVEYLGRKWNFAAQESLVVFMQERDMNLVFVNCRPPNWEPWLSDTTKWAEFAKMEVEHFDGDGVGYGWYPEIPGIIRPVKYWEICSEPNLWQGQAFSGTIEHFRRYVRIMSEAVHSADSSALVLAPGIPALTERWDTAGAHIGMDTFADSIWKWILEGGEANYIDIITFHQYGQSGPTSILPLIDSMKVLLNTYGVGDKPVWSTETGWFTGTISNAVDEPTQAQYYKEFATGMLQRPWLKKTMFFALQFVGDSGVDKRWGILDTNFIHKPAFNTLKNFISVNTPYVEVSSPKGGDVWKGDSLHNILWSATDSATQGLNITPDNLLSINIAYSLDSGKIWIPLAESLPNNGKYLWSVPNTTSNGCRVRVRVRDEYGLEGQYISGIFYIDTIPYKICPSPFHTSATILYSIDKKKVVSVKIYDIMGRIRQTLIDKEQSPGYYRITFTPDKYPTGVYFLRFQAGEYKKTEKIILVK